MLFSLLQRLVHLEKNYEGDTEHQKALQSVSLFRRELVANPKRHGLDVFLMIPNSRPVKPFGPKLTKPQGIKRAIGPITPNT